MCFQFAMFSCVFSNVVTQVIGEEVEIVHKSAVPEEERFPAPVDKYQVDREKKIYKIQNTIMNMNAITR